MSGVAPRHILFGVATGVVVAAIGAALVIAGSPSKQRERRMDEKRVHDLSAIGRAVDLYRSRRGMLPATLDDLSRQTDAMSSTRDPATAEPYEYRPLTGDTYELCAQFAHASDERNADPGNFWNHGAGRRCFVLRVKDVSR